MRELLDKLFSSDFMPHGYCYLWKPGLVWCPHCICRRQSYLLSGTKKYLAVWIDSLEPFR
jgi:hypothetical protein